MHKISPLLFIVFIFNTASYGFYEQKEVESTGEKRPRSSHISVRRTKVFITNKTNHDIKNLKVIFKFAGKRNVLNNKLSFNDSALGQVNEELPRNETIVVQPIDAISNGNGNRKPSDEFIKIENVGVICLGKDMYTYHFHRNGIIRKNEFVISRLGDHDVIETRRHYKKRIEMAAGPIRYSRK